MWISTAYIIGYVQDLAGVHAELLDEIRSSVTSGAKDLYRVFVNYKGRLLLYGRYCSQVETATKHLDKLASTREDVRMKLEVRNSPGKSLPCQSLV